MRKKWIILSATILAANIGLSGLSQAAEMAQTQVPASAVTANNQEERILGKVLGRQVIELPTFTGAPWISMLQISQRTLFVRQCPVSSRRWDLHIILSAGRILMKPKKLALIKSIRYRSSFSRLIL